MKRFVTHILPALALAAAIVSLSGCVSLIADFSAVTGRGDLQSYEIKTGEYSRIKVDGYCEVRYFASPSDSVTLEVQANLREYYVVEVVNNELVLRTTKNVNFGNDLIPVLTVSAPSLDRVAIEGAGNFTTYDKIEADTFDFIFSGAGESNAELDVNRLLVDISGAGSIEISGRADTAVLKFSGAGELEALPLKTREAEIDISGIGTVRISCSEKLTVNASGMGTVEYKGSPSIDISRGGMVSVKKIDPI